MYATLLNKKRVARHVHGRRVFGGFYTCVVVCWTYAVCPDRIAADPGASGRQLASSLSRFRRRWARRERADLATLLRPAMAIPNTEFPALAQYRTVRTWTVPFGNFENFTLVLRKISDLLRVGATDFYCVTVSVLTGTN